jgi:hypothetical protein
MTRRKRQPTNRFATLLREHKALFTVTAAAILFSTYCVKEIWREALNREIESIDSATNQLTLQQNFERLESTILQSQSAVSRSSDGGSNSAFQREEKIKLRYRLSVGAVMQSDKYTSAFLASAPAVEKKSRTERNKIEEEMRRKAVLMEEILHQNLPADRDTELFNTLGEIWVLNDKREALFISTAAEITEAKESKFAIASILGYCLYGIGSALGLAAQLSGAKEEGATEEG